MERNSLISFLRFNCDQDIINIFVYSQQQHFYEEKEKDINTNNINDLNMKKYILCKDNDIYCSVCCDKVKSTEYIRELNCKHTFHKKCIDKWIKHCIKNEEDINCPLCRTFVSK